MPNTPKQKKDEKTLVKCYVQQRDHQLIRMAAAAENNTIDEFVAAAAVSQAKKTLAKFTNSKLKD